jgi:uncharacterized membrane protein
MIPFMKKLKISHLLKLMSVFLILVLICLWFYWFQYRPTQIRKDCWEKTTESIKERIAEKGEVSSDSVSNSYSTCLVSKGLKSEPLLQK